MPIWMIVTEWMARLILVLLVGLSVWSIQIMLDRRTFFKELLAKTPSGNWDDQINQTSENTPQSLWQKALQAISAYHKPDDVDRAFDTFVEQENPNVVKGLSVLGTLGATAPFIGLLGTVLGIIKAFGDLSINAQNTNQVMFALAEALILTGVGLAVAIPAVIAFNYFQRKRNLWLGRLVSMKNTYVNQKVSSQ